MFMLAICVRFCSCLCNQVCSCVSGALLLTSRTLSLSFLTNNSSSDSKAFLRFMTLGVALNKSCWHRLTLTVTQVYVFINLHRATSAATLRYLVGPLLAPNCTLPVRSQAPQQQYTVLSFSSMRRHGHSHKLTSSL